MRIQTSRHFLSKLAARRHLRALKLLTLTTALSGGLLTSRFAQATPNTTHTDSTTGTANWSTSTWSNGVPTSANAGDLAAYATNGTSTTTTLDIDVTIGVVKNTAGTNGAWTIASDGTHAFTLDATGLTAANQSFGNAGTALLYSGASGALTINPNVILATSVDIGTGLSNSAVTVAGNVTATSAVAMNFRSSSTGPATISGNIGVTGSAIAISNFSSGAVNLSGSVGANVSSLTQNGSGTMTLSGTGNSFAGPISIVTGALTVSGAAQLGLGSFANTISDAGTFNYNSSAAQTISGSISGTGAVNVGGTGALSLSGNNTYQGGTTLASGSTLNINSATAIGTGALTLSGSGTIDNTSAAPITLTNNNNIALSGGSLTFTGTNSLSLGTGVVTASTANRTITTNGSTLTIGSLDADTTARTFTKAGAGTLAITGAAGANFQGGFSDSAGTTIIGNKASLGTGTISLSGGALAASANLSGANKLANALSVTASSAIGGSQALEIGGQTILSSGGSRTLTVNNSGGTTFSGTTYLTDTDTSGRTATINGSGNLTISGAIANNAAGTNTNATGLAYTGTGTLTLANTETYTGTTTVGGNGTVKEDFSAATAPTSNILLSTGTLALGSSGGGTLNLTGAASTANMQTVATLSVNAGSNRISYSPGAGGTVGLTVTNNVSTGASAHGTIQFDTTGTTTLSGNLSSSLLNQQNNTYATYGTDDYAVTNASGVVGAATYTNASSGFTTGVFNTVTGSFTTTTASLTLTGLRFADSTGRTVTYNTNTLTLGSILVASTAGTSALNGSGFIRNTRSTAGSNYDFDIIQNSANDFTIGASVGNASSSTTALVKAGTGRLILTNASNGYSAATYVNAGVLSISSNGNLGSQTTGAGLVLNGGNLETTANVSLDNSGANLRTLTLTSTSGLYALNGTTQTVTGVVSGAGTLNINPVGGTYTSSGNTITDTGTVTLNNIANTFTGDINVNAGILTSTVAGNAGGTGTVSAFGNTSVARNINVNNGGTLQFGNGDQLIGNGATPAATLVINAGGTVTNNGSSFNTLGPVNLNGGTLTGTGGSGNTQFQMYQLRGPITVGGTTASTISGSGTTAGYHLNGAITFNVADATSSSATDLTASATFIDGVGATPVAGGITKTGVGTMVLSGANTYTGGTLVGQGTLLANNASGSGTGTGAVTVNNAGRLGGTGTVSGAVTVNSGATLLGGNGLAASGALTLSTNPTLNSGSIIELVLGASGAHSSINLAGSFNGFNSNQAFTLDNIQVGTYDNIITGVAASIATGGWTVTNGSGFGYTFTDDGSNIDLSITAVPETSTWVGGLLLLGAVGFRQRRSLKGLLAGV